MRRGRTASVAPVALVALVVALGALAVACSDDGNDAVSTSTTVAPTTTAAPTTTVAPVAPFGNTFYLPPNPLPKAAPGTLIKSEPFPGTPAGSQAWRIMFHTTALDGSDVAESGMVIAPVGAAPSGGRDVVGYAHFTTGAGQICAPSLSTSPFVDVEGLPEFIQAGYVVVAPDYQGLGVAGPQTSFLVGESEGRSVLDAVRAARHLSGAAVGTRVVTWGHSQGGHASMFAAQLASSYAPDLHVLGAAGAGTPGPLGQLLPGASADTEEVAFALIAIGSYGNANPGTNPANVLTAAAQQQLPSAMNTCTLQIETSDSALVNNLFATDPSTVPPWQHVLAENSPGGVDPKVPVFLAQGGMDTLVTPASTAVLVKDYCDLGVAVQLTTYPDATHTLVGLSSLNDLVPWMAARFAGQPATNSSCSPGASGK
jgi:dienelactone hydrolase